MSLKIYTKEEMKELLKQKKTRMTSHFSVGDQVLLTYSHKKRQARTVGVIVEIIWGAYLNKLGRRTEPLKPIYYKIKTQHGGEFSAVPDDVRPGTILDRINVALED